MIRTFIPGGRRAAAPKFFRMLLAFVCMTAFAAAGCHRSANAMQSISVQEEIKPKPYRIGAAVVTIQLIDRAAQPVSHADVIVEADMNHPGMSPIFAPAKEIAPGSYEAHISFNMGGDWVVLSHIKLANGQKIEHQMDVRGVRASS